MEMTIYNVLYTVGIGAGLLRCGYLLGIWRSERVFISLMSKLQEAKLVDLAKIQKYIIDNNVLK